MFVLLVCYCVVLRELVHEHVQEFSSGSVFECVCDEQSFDGPELSTAEACFAVALLVALHGFCRVLFELRVLWCKIINTPVLECCFPCVVEDLKFAIVRFVRDCCLEVLLDLSFKNEEEWDVEFVFDDVVELVEPVRVLCECDGVCVVVDCVSRDFAVFVKDAFVAFVGCCRVFSSNAVP